MLTTRPQSGSDALQGLLQQRGAEVVNCPVIEFAAADQGPIKAITERIGGFSMLVFLSRRGVWASESLLQKVAGSPIPMAAIGAGSAECLRQLGYQVTLVPEQSNSESMANALIDYFRQNSLSKPLLVLRGDRGSEVLPQALSRAGVGYREVVVYESRDIQTVDPELRQRLAAGGFDWLTVTSSSIAANTAKLFGAAIGQTKIVSISPTTSAAAVAAGLSISAEATDYSPRGIVEAIGNCEETLRS